MFNFIKKLFKKKRLVKEIKNHHLIVIKQLLYSPLTNSTAEIQFDIKEINKYKAFNRMHSYLDKWCRIYLSYEDIQALEEIKRIVIDNITIEYNPYFPMEIIKYE